MPVFTYEKTTAVMFERAELMQRSIKRHCGMGQTLNQSELPKIILGKE